MKGEYPGKPVKGWMERKDMSQTWTGWKIYAEPGPGREPVTIVPGHDPADRHPTEGEDDG